MNNVMILCILILILIIIFLIIMISISKRKIKEIMIPLDLANDNINDLLKKKYKMFKEITKFIKDNLSIKEDAFNQFISFNSSECSQNDLIDILDKTTIEINEYVDNYDDLLKNKEFLDLKKNLYNIQVKLEATIDFYNNKIILYNHLKNNNPTSLATKFFSFDDYEEIKNEKKEISRLINLN